MIESIASIPPTFIDVMQSKPMRVKIDDRFFLELDHPSCVETIVFLQRITQCFSALKSLKEKEYTASIEKGIQIAYLTIYRVLCMATEKSVIWYKRNNYRKALYNKCITDVYWMSDLCEKIKDFYGYIKKKEESLALWNTSRQTYGVAYSSDLFQRALRQSKLERSRTA